MVEAQKTTGEPTDPEAESPMFALDQRISVEALRRIIAPQDPRDPVEEARMRAVEAHVNELLRSDLPPQEAVVHESSIYNLGGEAIFEYLPL